MPECREGWAAKAVVLHDAEDLVHPLEIKLFDVMTEKAALVQLPVIPLLDPDSRWVSGQNSELVVFRRSSARQMENSLI